jgi:transcription elongation GreA/GreB family factor
MNRHISKEVYSYIALHMKEIQSKKMIMVRQFSMDYDKYVKILGFLNRYIKNLEVYIDNAVMVEGESEPPFVTIGSIVGIKDSSRRSRSYIITGVGTSSTYEASNGCEAVSCFSELGMHLLLKEPGQEIKLEKSGVSGTISSIRYDMGSEVETFLHNR